MRKRARLTVKEQVDIVEAYESRLVQVAQLAKQYAISRQAIYKILHKFGVDVTTQEVTISCNACSNEIARHKSRIRRQQHIFCSQDCYLAFVRANHGVSRSHTRALARQVVSKYFALRESHVVHHENKNPYDNRLDNLKVFANRGDHIMYLRGLDVTPIWEGCDMAKDVKIQQYRHDR